jgi:Tfp pilus assembly protein PilN
MFERFRQRFSRSKELSATSPGLDFLPDGYAERRRIRRTNAFCLVLFVAVVSAVGATFHVSENSLAAVVSEYRGVNERYTLAARQIDQVRQMLEKRKTVADRVELAVSLREKLPRSNLLAEVTNGLPEGVSLTECSLEAKRLTAAAPARTSFEQKAAAGQPAEAPPQPLAFDTKLLVTGVSYTEAQVSDYLDALKRCGYFESVDLKWVRKGNPVNPKDETMRTFSLSLQINPSAEANPAQARSKVRLNRLPETAATDTQAMPPR